MPTAEATDFFRDLERRRQAELEALRQAQDTKEGHGRHRPEEFVDSSYLYLRAFEGDTGERPLAGQVFWLSPDIGLSPVTSPEAYTRTLESGETYRIRCLLRNLGDLAVPSAKVELWLCDPSLGFSTEYATCLTKDAPLSVWVGPQATAEVSFEYTVPPTEAGHKCLFARVFSFSPLDLPLDDHALDPTVDRHVGQQNLSILQQGETLEFGVVHAPNTRQEIAFVPLLQRELAALPHPVARLHLPARDWQPERLRHLFSAELTGSTARNVDLSRSRSGVALKSFGITGAETVAARALGAQVRSAVHELGRPGAPRNRELFAEYRRHTRTFERSVLSFHVPDLGLKPGELVGAHLVSQEQGDGRASTLGGVTVLITG